MQRQLLKTFNGYEVVYDDKYRINRYIIKDKKKIIERYDDFTSCVYWIHQNMTNKERELRTWISKQ